MAGRYDAEVTAGVELAFVVGRVVKLLEGMAEQAPNLAAPRLHTRVEREAADGRELGVVLKEVLQTGSTSARKLLLAPDDACVALDAGAAVDVSPGYVTEPSAVDYQLPAVGALGARLLLAEELLDAVEIDKLLAASVKKHVTIAALESVRDDASSGRLLDNNPVFRPLIEAVVAQASKEWFTPTRTNRRALARLPAASASTLATPVASPADKGSVWLERCFVAATALGLTRRVSRTLETYVDNYWRRLHLG